MASTHLTPSLRRLAIFLVAIALVAAISPGLAVAANGVPKPVEDAITTPENAPATGNVLLNDENLGEGDLTVTGGDFVDPGPEHWHAHDRGRRRLRVHARRRLERLDDHDLYRRQLQP